MEFLRREVHLNFFPIVLEFFGYRKLFIFFRLFRPFFIWQVDFWPCWCNNLSFWEGLCKGLFRQHFSCFRIYRVPFHRKGSWKSSSCFFLLSISCSSFLGSSRFFFKEFLFATLFAFFHRSMEDFGPLFKQIIDGVRAHQEDPQPDKEKTDKIRANI